MARIGSFDVDASVRGGIFSDAVVQGALGWIDADFVDPSFQSPEMLDRHRSGHQEPHVIVNF